MVQYFLVVVYELVIIILYIIYYTREYIMICIH